MTQVYNINPFAKRMLNVVPIRIQGTSLDQIDWTGPGLIAVFGCDANPDRVIAPFVQVDIDDR